MCRLAEPNVEGYIPFPRLRILTQTHTLGGQRLVRAWQCDLHGYAVGYSENDKHFSYAYDHAGQLTRVARPDGKTFEYTYDSRGNLTNISEADADIIQVFDASDRFVHRETVEFRERRNKGHDNNDNHDDEDVGCNEILSV